MTRSVRARYPLVSAMIGTLLMSPAARAHNNVTHELIVNQAWESMRAANRQDLVNRITWQAGQPPPNAARLDLPGACALPATDPANLCGEQVSDSSWTQYLADIGLARQVMSGLASELPDSAKLAAPNGPDLTSPPDSTCLDTGRSNLPLGDINPCGYGNVSRVGIFQDFSVPADGKGNQGHTLGWHAQSRDEDQDDTWIDITPGAQVIDGASRAFESATGALLFPFVALVAIFSWDFDLDDILSKSHRLADDVDPIDYVKGILPGFHNDEASADGRTLWHFINVRAGVSNEYDDNQGLFYEEAGPAGQIGGVDHAIMVGADLAFFNLDASHSAGTERYEITDKETSFAHPSSDRGEVRWQMENIGHTPMAPLDNFAAYGDTDFPDNHPGGVERGHPFQMGWPLHAIGDASVPMHVVGTTGWGHRPFEDFTQHGWPVLMYEQCPPDTSSDARACIPGWDTLKAEQLAQTQRILQRGYRWRAYLRTHDDIRDFITQIARETLSLAGEATADLVSGGALWCDACSTGYMIKHVSGELETDAAEVALQYTGDSLTGGFADPEGYYWGTFATTAALKADHHQRIFAPARELVERAVGATVGYLLFRSPATGACVATASSCGAAGQTCCSGGKCVQTSTAQSACCGAGGGACYIDADCCSGRCTGEVCEPSAGDPCDASGSCPSTQGSCFNGKCCLPTEAHCVSNAGCCSGLCIGRTCT